MSTEIRPMIEALLGLDTGAEIRPNPAEIAAIKSSTVIRCAWNLVKFCRDASLALDNGTLHLEELIDLLDRAGKRLADQLGLEARTLVALAWQMNEEEQEMCRVFRWK